MFDFLAGVLAELYKLWPSYGGAIILFTTLIMVVLSPLSIKSTRSMIAMQRVGPEVKKLQQKHKGDREALNREMMAFYQEHNINPFSSCLPLILQIPVFIVLYQVLIGLTRRAVEGDASSVFNPKYLEGENTPLAVALRGTNKMISFGMDLSQSALTELRTEGLFVALPFVVLVGLVVLTSIVQQRQVQGRNPSAATNPQQQMIAKVLPFIFIPISVSIPAGVVIYFVVSNMVRIGQQALVTRLDFKDLPPPSGDESAGKKTPTKPGGPKDNGRPERIETNKRGAKAGGAKAGAAKGASTNGAGRKGQPARSRAKGGEAKTTTSGGASKRAKAKGSAARQLRTKEAGPSGTEKSANGSGPGGVSSPAPRPRKRKRKRR
ncbi:MAG: YidC/Oxa1 family membrane protein insertase [Actinomycetota bacterium]|nr:YidC/Oxa1 family membrane protein insertase [Actinomycetota bacterium]